LKREGETSVIKPTTPLLFKTVLREATAPFVVASSGLLVVTPQIKVCQQLNSNVKEVHSSFSTVGHSSAIDIVDSIR